MNQPMNYTQNPHSPQPRDMRLVNANKQVESAQIVSKPNFLVRILEHIAENPFEFALSTISAIAVRAGIIGFLGPGIGSVIAAAMITSVVLSVGKQLLSGGPSEAELADARNAEIGGSVMNSTLKKSLMSGAIAGILGVALGPLADAMDLDIADKLSAPEEISETVRYVPDDSVEQAITDLRPVNLDEFANREGEGYNHWRTEKSLRIDGLVSRDFTDFYPNSPHIDRMTDIPDNLGHDALDAHYVRRNVLEAGNEFSTPNDVQYDAQTKAGLFPFPEEILDATQRSAFEGKTIMVDVGHYQIADAGTGRYDLGAVYDANGNNIFEGVDPAKQTYQVTLDNFSGKPQEYTAITGLVDAKGDPYTFATKGPAFLEDGTPVAIEAHVNLRNAIEYGEQARAMGADVVYTNLGRLEAGGYENQLQYRKSLAEDLANAGHKPDLIISFHADAAGSNYTGLRVVTPQDAYQECNDLARLISDSCNGEIKSDNLQIFDDMPLADQNVPSILVETANLANPADNELSRLYPHERIDDILRGTADYFIEQEQCITFDNIHDPAVEASLNSVPQQPHTHTPPIDTDTIPPAEPAVNDSIKVEETTPKITLDELEKAEDAPDVPAEQPDVKESGTSPTLEDLKRAAGETDSLENKSFMEKEIEKKSQKTDKSSELW